MNLGVNYPTGMYCSGNSRSVDEKVAHTLDSIPRLSFVVVLCLATIFSIVYLKAQEPSVPCLLHHELPDNFPEIAYKLATLFEKLYKVIVFPNNINFACHVFSDQAL